MSDYRELNVSLRHLLTKRENEETYVEILANQDWHDVFNKKKIALYKLWRNKSAIDSVLTVRRRHDDHILEIWVCMIGDDGNKHYRKMWHLDKIKYAQSFAIDCHIYKNHDCTFNNVVMPADFLSRLTDKYKDFKIPNDKVRNAFDAFAEKMQMFSNDSDVFWPKETVLYDDELNVVIKCRYDGCKILSST